MNILGDAALAQIRELIRQEQGRVRGNRADHEPKLTKGPEMFMAYSSTGIDAATEDEGTITAAYADCDLYERDPDTDELKPLYVSGTTPNQRKVYNASTTSISVGLFPIWRDKRGTWWAKVSGTHDKRFGFTGSGGIDAATLSSSQITPGSASVTEWRWNGTVYEASDAVTVYNPWPDTIVGNRLISFSLDQDGLLTIDAEACNAFEEESP